MLAPVRRVAVVIGLAARMRPRVKASTACGRADAAVAVKRGKGACPLLPHVSQMLQSRVGRNNDKDKDISKAAGHVFWGSAALAFLTVGVEMGDDEEPFLSKHESKTRYRHRHRSRLPFGSNATLFLLR